MNSTIGGIQVIKKYGFGKLIDTKATVLSIEESKDKMPYFNIEKQEIGCEEYRFIYRMDGSSDSHFNAPKEKKQKSLD